MPNAPEYHAGSGFSLLNIYVDRAKQSMEAFEKALALDPHNVDALEGLGIVYASTGQRAQAEGLHERLRQLDGDAAARLSEYIRWGIDWQR
jgi:Flp pilus assembly protein TadD